MKKTIAGLFATAAFAQAPEPAAAPAKGAGYDVKKATK